MRPLFVLLLVALSLLFGGCTNSEPTQPLNPVSLTLKPGDTTISPGGVVELEAVIEPRGTWGLRWKSSGGTLTAAGAEATYVAPTDPGTFVITVALPGEGLEDSLTVSVVDQDLGAQTVTITSVSGDLRIASGTTLALAAVVTGSE